ncbi:MAG: cysteine desulfurase, partial [Pseudomonadota bacterium]
GILWAPKGVQLQTEAEVAQQARAIYLQSGVSHAMPPANMTWMEPDERAAIVAWYRGARE